MILICRTSAILFSIVLSFSAVPSIQRSRQVSLYFGPYYVNGPSPNNMPEFGYFWINAGKQPSNPKIGTSVSVGGYLHTKDEIDYKFANAKLTMGNSGFDRLTFTTQKIKGTLYRFEGSFLGEPRFVASTHNYTKLHGRLIKEQSDRPLSEATVYFNVRAEE